jgi:membrane protein
MKDPSPPTPKQSKSLWKLGGLSPWQLVLNVFDQIKTNNTLGRASELAFDFLFALFPLILLMLTLFGLFASRGVELQTDLLSYFADFLPQTAFQLLRATVVELAQNVTGGKLTFGIVFALWFASSGVSSMISALNAAYRVSDDRSWFKIRTVALGLTLLISLHLLAALLIVLASSHFADWIGAQLHLLPLVVLLLKTLQWPAAIAFVLVSYSLVYFYGPDLNQRSWRWITPGSAFGAFLWLMSSVGMRVYLHFLNTYSAFYGSLGAVMILLVWLYVAGLAFLIGGAINAEIERAAAGGAMAT